MALVMSKSKKKDDRSRRRKRITQPAEITDLEKSVTISCMIRDASHDGCQIIGANIDDLPDEFLLTPSNHDFTVKGVIIWREPHRAGAQVDWANTMFA